MADPTEEKHIITLVTSDDPPIELAVKHEKLFDSRVFSDMLSLPKTGDCKARVDVAEPASELEAWIEFLNSGKLESPLDNAGGEGLGRKAVAIAKLVDKYGCTVSRHLLIAELWRMLAERATHPLFIVLASDHVQADHVQRLAAAEVLALRAAEEVSRATSRSGFMYPAVKGERLEKQYIGEDRFGEWDARVSAWGTLVIPEKSRLVVECSGKYGPSVSCQYCTVPVADAWRELVLAAGRAENPFESFTRSLKSHRVPGRRICSSHTLEFCDALHELDMALRQKLPPLPPP